MAVYGALTAFLFGKKTSKKEIQMVYRPVQALKQQPPIQAFSYCPHCGVQVVTEGNFCARCGNRFI